MTFQLLKPTSSDHFICDALTCPCLCPLIHPRSALTLAFPPQIDTAVPYFYIVGKVDPPCRYIESSSFGTRSYVWLAPGCRIPSSKSVLTQAPAGFSLGRIFDVTSMQLTDSIVRPYNVRRRARPAADGQFVPSLARHGARSDSLVQSICP